MANAYVCRLFRLYYLCYSCIVKSKNFKCVSKFSLGVRVYIGWTIDDDVQTSIDDVDMKVNNIKENL